MILTLEQMLNAEQTLIKISENDLPATTAWRLLKTIQQIQKECNLFREFRANKIKEYGEFDEVRGDYIINEQNPNFNKFIEELTPLLKEESEINVIPISIEDLSKIELSIHQIKSVEWMISE